MDNTFSDSIKIKQVSINDISNIYDIESKSYEISWPLHFFSDIIKESDNFSITARSKGLIVGYLFTKTIIDEIELLNIAVHPDFRRRNIAKNMLTNLIDFSQSEKIRKIFLEVRKSNYNAINLYKKFNFKKISVRKNYYKNNSEDAIVMCRNNIIQI